MRSFQVSADEDEDEDGGSPCRIFGSSEAIFIYLVLVGLSFGDNNIAVLRPGSRADICWFCFCYYLFFFFWDLGIEAMPSEDSNINSYLGIFWDPGNRSHALIKE
jgi:hypothetical protein